MEMNYLKELENLNIRVVSITGDEALCFCPLHDDHSPSLSVNLKSGLHNCFAGCTKGKFETLRRNVAESGVIQKDIKSATADDELIELARRVHRSVFNSSEPAYLNDFLTGRGFDNDTVDEWNIRKGFLSIIIPVYNEQHKIQGLIYRMTGGDDKGRYLYSKGFRRNENLFGIDKVEKGEVGIIVEGCFDCMRACQYGFKNCVAILGRSISDYQVGKIIDLFSSVFLFLDNDIAGKKAIIKAAEQLMSRINISVPNFNTYKSKDPADCSTAEFKGIYESRIPYLLSKIKGG